jgi:hypothetical protein
MDRADRSRKKGQRTIYIKDKYKALNSVLLLNSIFIFLMRLRHLTLPHVCMLCYAMYHVNDTYLATKHLLQNKNHLIN